MRVVGHGSCVVGHGFRAAVLAVLVFFLHTGCFGKETIDPYAWDFGRVSEGEIVKHTFSLKNESKKALTIKDLHTSCGCTASEIKKKVLGPGESTEIAVSFNSKGYSGEVKQFIYVNTDDIDNPVIRFIIKGVIASEAKQSK